MVNPMVAWIWVAAAVMAVGGLVTLVPARAASWRAEPSPAAGRPEGAVARG
jgi:cytochrome c biogenesis factor